MEEHETKLVYGASFEVINWHLPYQVKLCLCRIFVALTDRQLLLTPTAFLKKFKRVFEILHVHLIYGRVLTPLNNKSFRIISPPPNPSLILVAARGPLKNILFSKIFWHDFD